MTHLYKMKLITVLFSKNTTIRNKKKGYFIIFFFYFLNLIYICNDFEYFHK